MFGDDLGNTVTVASLKYADILEKFFSTTSSVRSQRVHVFQQDVTTPHTATVSINGVAALFPNQVNCRNGNIAWPIRSPDLKTCDFFLVWAI